MTMSAEKSSSNCFRQRHNSWRPPVRLLVVVPVMVALLLSSCSSPPSRINQYILEYPPPPLAKQRPLDTGIKVALFAVDETINRSEMVYKESQYRTGAYRYNRWRANPGYLVTDNLTRDLKESRLFKVVVSRDFTEPARFRLDGDVVDFQENDMPDAWKAALTLNITLLDTDKETIAARVLFQRSYQTLEPMTTMTPQGLADAMNCAMQKVSKQIIDDVYRAVKLRLGQEKN